MTVREIQYLSRDFCTLFSKPLVYLHYVSNMDKYPNASYQYVLKKEPFTADSTEEGIITEFKDYVGSNINVSKLCRSLVFVHEFQSEYSGIIDDIETYPEFKVTKYDLSNSSDPMPDCALVWEINKISPKVCGILFENIIAHGMELNEKCYDLSSCLTSPTSNISKKTIEGILERNFIKRHLLRSGNNVRINNKNVVFIGDSKLCEDDFISMWHYLVFLSLRHFIKRDFSGADLEDCLKILEYINMNVKYMEEYYYDMMDSTFVKNLKKETNLKHGDIYRTDKMHGEIDFITDSSIIDIKAYKNDELSNWFAQLYLYEKLAGKRKSLKIVNVYSNEVFEFSYEMSSH